jgi:hypothetical protein
MPYDVQNLPIGRRGPDFRKGCFGRKQADGCCSLDYKIPSRDAGLVRFHALISDNLVVVYSGNPQVLALSDLQQCLKRPFMSSIVSQALRCYAYGGNVSNLFAKHRRDDTAVLSGTAKSLPHHHLTGWAEKFISKPQGEAAHRNTFGVDDIDQDGNCLPESLADALHYRFCDGISTARGFGYITRSNHLWKAPSACAERGPFSTCGRQFYVYLRDLRHPAATSPSFHRSNLSMTARARPGQSHMAYLASCIGRPSLQLSVENQSGSKTCTHGEKNEVLRSAPSSEVRLG